jgi:hypothetical protein
MLYVIKGFSSSGRRLWTELKTICMNKRKKFPAVFTINGTMSRDLIKNVLILFTLREPIEIDAQRRSG